MEYVLKIEVTREQVGFSRTSLGFHEFTADSDEQARKIAHDLVEKTISARLFRLMEEVTK